MAGVYPTAAGAYSTRTWNDDATGAAYGPGVPQAGDTVYANGLAITIDTSITVAALSTRPGTTAVAGGSFTGSGAVVVTADSYAGTTSCLSLSGINQEQIGDSYGSNSTNTCFGSVVNLGAIQNGNAYGGNGSNRAGSDVASGTLNGNSYGGTGSLATGARVRNFGTQIGNSYGGTANATFGTTLTFGSKQVGDSYGSDVAGVSGTDIQSGGNHIGNSYGGAASSSFGTQIGGGFHSGIATGGSGSLSYGTSIQNGGVFYGKAVGGSNSTAYGVNVTNGSLCVATDTEANAASAIRLQNFSNAILQQNADLSDILISASEGLYSLSTDTSSDFPFVGGSSGSGGFPLSRVLN